MRATVPAMFGAAKRIGSRSVSSGAPGRHAARLALEPHMTRYSHRLAIIAAAVATASLVVSSTSAQRNEQKQAPDKRIAEAVVSPDQEMGKRFRVNADELPAPKATPAVSNRSLVLPHEGQTPKVPEGFTVTLF